MQIVSRGYEGTVDYEDWAVLTTHLGAQYSVFDVDSFGLSAGPGDRQVVLAPGRAAGQGIYDISDSPVTLAGASVLSGSRWDMVALRRNYESGETIPVLVTGGAARAIPERENTPGVLDDHPLFLARFTAGQTAVQEIVDLRVWHGDGGLVARDPIVRDYLTRIGTRIWIQGTEWIRGLNNVGLAEWFSTAREVVEQKNLGASISGVNIAPNGAYSPLIHKSGRITDFGTAAFGNQYLSAMVFPTPFPTGLLSVQVTPLQIDGAVAGLFAIDLADRNGFRVFFPGSGAGTKRAVLWTAVGY